MKLSAKEWIIIFINFVIGVALLFLSVQATNFYELFEINSIIGYVIILVVALFIIFLVFGIIYRRFGEVDEAIGKIEERQKLTEEKLKIDEQLIDIKSEFRYFERR